MQPLFDGVNSVEDIVEIANFKMALFFGWGIPGHAM
jgi:hypothetical protein